MTDSERSLLVILARNLTASMECKCSINKPLGNAQIAYIQRCRRCEITDVITKVEERKP